MDRKLIDFLGFGLILWIAGFVVSIIVWPFVPVDMIGWFVLPVMLVLTVVVSFRRLRGLFSYYMFAGVSWLVVAIILDYIFIITALGVQNYYDTDVFIYYLITFAIPCFAGMKYSKPLSAV